jgi:peptidoglycan/LPS O-acetylase OafA/YrhL
MQPRNTGEKSLLGNEHILLLDGVRGIAILMVLAYHFMPVAGIGWVGVSLFFVLSGFLISWRLEQSIESDHYFRHFYIRRILRIVPLYMVVLVVLLILVPLLLPVFVTSSYAELLGLQGWYWTFTQNLYNARHGWPDNITLVHFWSLAVEMQFYLLWPFVMRLFNKRPRLFIGFLLSLMICALLFRVYGGDIFKLNDLYRYVLLPSRIDSFAAGCLLLVLLNRYKEKCRSFFLWIWIICLAMAVIIYSFFATVSYMGAFSQTAGHTLHVLFWTALLGYLMLLPAGAFGARIFSGRFLVAMGKYSYGMYIVHLPVWIVMTTLLQQRYGQPWHSMPGAVFYLPLVAFAITWLLGVLSYHCLEKYFLRIKLR